MRILPCLLLFLIAGCAAQHPSAIVLPDGYKGLFAVAVNSRYSKPKPDYVLHFPESGYLRLNVKSFRPWEFLEGPNTVEARYSDGTAIPVQPKDGFGIYGFAGASIDHDTFVWFFFAGDRSQLEYYLGVPAGYPEQKRWLKEREL